MHDKHGHEPHFVDHSYYPDVSLHVPGHLKHMKFEHQLRVLDLPEQGLRGPEQVFKKVVSFMSMAPYTGPITLMSMDMVPM